jgi:hypothetical protein
MVRRTDSKFCAAVKAAPEICAVHAVFTGGFARSKRRSAPPQTNASTRRCVAFTSQCRSANFHRV